MIILIGFVILLVAVAIGIAGVLGNGGGAHLLTDPFSVFGFEVNGSTGLLFLWGMVVGAAGLFGLNLMISGARRTARRGRVARRELKSSRRETAAVSRDRDELAERLQPATTGGGVTTTPASAIPAAPSNGAHGGDGRVRHRRFGRLSSNRNPVTNSPGDGRR